MAATENGSRGGKSRTQPWAWHRWNPLEPGVRVGKGVGKFRLASLHYSWGMGVQQNNLCDRLASIVLARNWSTANWGSDVHRNGVLLWPC